MNGNYTVTTEELLACINILSEKGISFYDMERFVCILKRKFSDKGCKDAYIYIEYPNSRIHYMDDKWRDYYDFKGDKYFLKSVLYNKKANEEIEILKRKFPFSVIEESITEFNNLITV